MMRVKRLHPSLPIVVDGFLRQRWYLTHHVLTHFHSDHFQGLSGNTLKPSAALIYCTETTAKLCHDMLRVPKTRFFVLPRNTWVSLPRLPKHWMVQVFVVDANHCPGAGIFFFRVSNLNERGSVQRLIHTGDFRFDKMVWKAHSALWEEFVGSRGTSPLTLFLDTTYLSPKYAFPTQRTVLAQCQHTAQSAVAKYHKTLFCCGSYTIGKEKVAIALALALRLRYVYVSEAKARVLQHVRWMDVVHTVQQQLLHPSPTKAPSHNNDSANNGSNGKTKACKKNESGGDNESGDNNGSSGDNESSGNNIKTSGNIESSGNNSKTSGNDTTRSSDDVLPTLAVWRDNAVQDGDAAASVVRLVSMGEVSMEAGQDLLRQWGSRFDQVVLFRPTGWAFHNSSNVRTSPCGRVKVCAVPYSEHSSFAELRDCVATLKPTSLIPTVDASSEKAVQKQLLYFADMAGVDMDRRGTLLHHFSKQGTSPTQDTLTDSSVQDSDAENQPLVRVMSSDSVSGTHATKRQSRHRRPPSADTSRPESSDARSRITFFFGAEKRHRATASGVCRTHPRHANENVCIDLT